MNTRRSEISELLPHRDPFLFVDKILSSTEEEIIGTKIFSKKDGWLKGSFPESGFIPGMILVESIAQCGGAGIKLLGIAEGIFALTSIEQVNFYAGGLYGKKIKYLIKNQKISRNIIQQSGIAMMGKLKLMEATWMSVKVR
jgi:3-hydroxyacyl-[acyl-carrier-protein] dehydratase